MEGGVDAAVAVDAGYAVHRVPIVIREPPRDDHFVAKGAHRQGSKHLIVGPGPRVERHVGHGGGPQAGDPAGRCPIVGGEASADQDLPAGKRRGLEDPAVRTGAGGIERGIQVAVREQTGKAVPGHSLVVPEIAADEDLAIRLQAYVLHRVVRADARVEGRVQVAVGKQPGDTHPRYRIVLGEVAHDQDLAVRLPFDVVHFVVRAETAFRIEGQVRGAVRVQACDVPERKTAGIGEVTADEHFPVGLQLDGPDVVVGDGIERAVQAAVRVQPGDVVERCAVVLVEIAADDDLAIGLQRHGQDPRRETAGHTGARVEGIVQAAVGVQASDAVAGHTVVAGELPGEEDPSVGLLQGGQDVPAGRARGRVEGGVKGPVRLQTGHPVPGGAVVAGERADDEGLAVGLLYGRLDLAIGARPGVEARVQAPRLSIGEAAQQGGTNDG